MSLQRSAPHLIEALGDEGLALYFAAKIDRLLLNYYSGTVTTKGSGCNTVQALKTLKKATAWYSG